ncbi:MAG: hypothetical protein JNL70_15210 [Saprospiraceae bacterium]|nr:hypothetical protein [Saprospiraceae bacterium]
MANQTIFRLFNLFFIAYTISFALEQLLSIRTPIGIIFLPEILYIPLSVTFLFCLPTIWKHRKQLLADWLFFDSLVIIYAIIVATSYAFHPTSNSLREMVGCGYMSSFYFMTTWVFRTQNSLTLLQNGVKIFAYSGVLASIIAIGSYLIGLLGLNQTVAQTHEYYPLIGDAMRSFGLFRNPIFHANYLACTLIVFASYEFDKIKKGQPFILFLLFLFGLALFLTKTKSVLIVFALGLFFLTKMSPLSKTVKYSFCALSVFAVLSYLCLSHLLIIKTKQPNLDIILSKGYYFPQFLWQITDDYAIVPTFYYGTKRAALLAFYDSFPWGIGGDNLTNYVHQLVAQGRHLRPFCCAPHSTFFGALGELGLLGLAAILTFFTQLVKMIKKIRVFDAFLPQFALMSKSLIFFLCCEAVTVDLMNVRYFWLIMATFVLFYKTQLSKPAIE